MGSSTGTTRTSPNELRLENNLRMGKGTAGKSGMSSVRAQAFPCGVVSTAYHLIRRGSGNESVGN